MADARTDPYVRHSILDAFATCVHAPHDCRFDPPRADTAATVGEAGQLGVRIKMLTGDAVAIAKETCKQLALGTNVYDSERLIGGSMAGSEVRDFIEAADGFAEVFPEHKYQVVSMLQQRGHLTAMTGDGVSECRRWLFCL